MLPALYIFKIIFMTSENIFFGYIAKISRGEKIDTQALIKIRETVKLGLEKEEEQIIKLLVSRACANLKYSFKRLL